MSSLEQPLVSVVIPCYNHEKFVMDCIQSVIDQTYQNIELIIIDDGSKDSSVLKIKEMLVKCEERFTRFEFRSRVNKGLAMTLNEAIEWCEGQYYSAIASDDMMFNEKIKIQVDFFKNNNDINVVGVFGGYKLIDENNAVIECCKKSETSYNFKDIILHKHDLPAPTQMLILTKLKEAGGYSSQIIIEDWYMWLKLSKIGKLHYLSEYLAFYRNHSENISKKVEVMHCGRNQVLKAYASEKEYKLAEKEIFWIYLAQLKNYSFNKFFIKFTYFILKNPIFFLKKILLVFFKLKYFNK